MEFPADGITAATLRTALEGRENVGLSPVELLATALLAQGARQGMEPYVTGAGQVLTVHSAGDGCTDSCVVHNPSGHTLRGAPTLWRADRQLMERTCAHGVGHPDPDDLAFKRRRAAATAYAQLIKREDPEWRAYADSQYGNGADNVAKINARQTIRRFHAEGVHGCDGCCATAE